MSLKNHYPSKVESISLCCLGTREIFMSGKLMCAKSMLQSMHKMDVSRHLWRTAIYLLGRQLSKLGFNGAVFQFFPFNCGLNWSCDFMHAKIDSLAMDGMAIVIAGLNFCLCLLCRQQSEPLGCGDVWDCDVFLERMARTIFC